MVLNLTPYRSVLRSLLLLLSVLGMCAPLAAQRDKLAEKGHEAYEAGQYEEAILLYTQSLARRFNKTARFNLAASNVYLHRYDDAARSYAAIVKLKNVPAQTYLEYAQVLLLLDQPEKARPWLQTYRSKNPGDPVADNLALALDRRLEYYVDQDNYTLSSLLVNSEKSDVATTWWDGTLGYITAAKLKGYNRPYNWDLPRRFELHTYAYPSAAREVDLNLPGGLWGPVAFDDANREVFVSVLGSPRKKIKDEDIQQNRMHIYHATWDNGKPGTWRSLPINTEGFNVSHPAISPDGKRLYFASDMAGGQGGTDLYYIERLPDGNWTEPRALPENINSAGNEYFPSVSPDGDLYFSSDGWGGLGGTDIFRASNSNNFTGPVANLGAPINSPANDLNFLAARSGSINFLSSERAGRGDIFSVQTNVPMASGGVYLFDASKESTTITDVATRPELIDDFPSEENPDMLPEEIVEKPVTAASDLEIEASEGFLNSEESSDEVVLTDTPPANTPALPVAETLMVAEAPVTTQPAPTEKIVGQAQIQEGRYSIQLGSFKQTPDPYYFEPLGELRKNLWEEQKGDVVVYRIGHARTKEAAARVLPRVIDRGYKDAFIYEAPVVDWMEPDTSETIAQMEDQIKETEGFGGRSEETPNLGKEATPKATIEDPIVEVEELPAPNPEEVTELVETLEAEPLPIFMTVQIGAFRYAPDEQFTQGLGDLKNEIWSIPVGKIDRYSIGKYNSYDRAVEVLDDVRQLYPDAFLAAYSGDERIAIEEAVKRLGN